MRKGLQLVTTTMVLFLALATIQSADARSGAGRDLPCTVILDGEPVAVSGTVSECCLGQGLVVDTGSEMVSLYGLGPIWYWQQIGVDRPAIGDQIESDTRRVTFSDGTTRLVMMRIVIDETDVQLRDPATGCPMWR